MQPAQLLRDLLGGPDGPRELTETEAAHLYGAMLDGGLPELELGAVLAVFALRPESVDELMGFHRAVSERVQGLQAPRGAARVVSIGSYTSSDGLPNLTPLLALLLRRLNVPVLVHGGLQGEGRATGVHLFRELGVMPCSGAAQAAEHLEIERIAFVPTAVLCPGLTPLLMLRHRIGVRNLSHLLARLMDPFAGEGFPVVGVEDGPRLASLRELFGTTGGRGLLLASAGGEPFANPLRRPRLEVFEEGVSTVLFEAETLPPRGLPQLPAAGDDRSVLAWTRQALAGEAPIPMPVVNQLACCLYGAGYTSDINQAKAIVAVQAGSLAAA